MANYSVWECDKCGMQFKHHDTEYPRGWVKLDMRFPHSQMPGAWNLKFIDLCTNCACELRLIHAV